MAFFLFASVVLLSSLQQTAVASPSSDDLSQIVISPESLLVFSGNSLLIPCVAYVHGNDTSRATLSWRKDGTPLSSSSRFIFHDPLVTDMSGVLFVKVVLEICDVTPSDGGEYDCVLSVGGEEKDSANFEITVSPDNVPAQIILAPEPREVSENETLLVTCVAFGLPSPVITWTQNDHLLTDAANTDTATAIHNEVTVRGGVRLVKSTLEICNVQGIASGEYRCTAGNGFGSGNASFAITRKAPIQLLAGPDSHSVYVRTEAYFTCDFHSSPLPRVTWSGVPLTSGGRFSVDESVVHSGGIAFVRSTLTVAPVAEYDGGEISCEATNELGDLRHTFNVNVVVPPMVVVSPNDIHLSIDSYPRTLTLACVAFTTGRLKWEKGDTEIVTSPSATFTESSFIKDGRHFVTSILEICDVGIDASDEYSCVAEDQMGRDVATFDVCVVASTGLIVAPSDHILMIGHTLSLPCVAYTTVINAPHTLVSWSAGNRDIVTSSKFTVRESYEEKGGVVLIRSTLLVSCIEPEDAAQYACHVTTGSDRTSVGFTVDVQVPPIIKDALDHTHTTGKGSTVSLTCLASGIPLPAISWFKDDSLIRTDIDKRVSLSETTVPGFENALSQAVESILTITLVTEDDSGQYRCVAVSDSGIAELEIPYIVIVDPSLAVTEGQIVTVSVGIEHASYIGTVIGFLCLLVVFTLYVAIRSLRMHESTPPLLNTCLSLMALNVSFIISYNTTQTGNACVFFAALFHYFFLAAMLAVTNLVVLKAKKKWASRKQRLFAYGIAFSLNWGVPLLVLIPSLAPDVSNYAGSESGHFCGPTLWPYWFGALLPFGLIHLPTWFAFFLISCLNKPSQSIWLDRSWLRDSVATALTLLLFDIAWGVGLPSTQQTSAALQSLFVIFTTLLGFSILLLYCLLSSTVRHEVTKVVTRGNVSPDFQKASSSSSSTSNQLGIEDSSQGVTNPLNRATSQLSLSGIEAAKELFTDSVKKEDLAVGTPPRTLITSFSEEDDYGGVDAVGGRRSSVMGPTVVNLRLPQGLEDSGVQNKIVYL